MIDTTMRFLAPNEQWAGGRRSNKWPLVGRRAKLQDANLVRNAVGLVLALESCCVTTGGGCRPAGI